MKHYDCLVIGLGGVGSSVLRQLASRGLEVCGLDQFSPTHDRGSSHGRHRVFRKAYFEHPDYVPLLHRAEELWRELERETGQDLYRRCGVLLTGPEAGPAISGTRLAARQHDLPLQQLTSAEAGRRWPLLRFRTEDAVLLDEDAGILSVEPCVSAQLTSAQRYGADVCFETPVIGWSQTGDSVRVSSAARTWQAEQLVIAGGAWAGELLTGELPELTVLRKQQLWHEVSPDRQDALTRLPAFYCETGEGAFYGMPSGDGRLKVARHTDGAPVHSPGDAAAVSIAAETRAIEQFSEQRLSGLEQLSVVSSGCLYTVTPDGHFVVDRHSEHDRVVYAAGLSGHGFKFASVLGQILADMICSKLPDFRLDFLGASRFR